MIFLLIAGFGLSLTSTDHEGHIQPEGKHGGLLKIPYVKPLLATLVSIGITFGAQYVVILAVAREGGRAAEGGSGLDLIQSVALSPDLPSALFIGRSLQQSASLHLY